MPTVATCRRTWTPAGDTIPTKNPPCEHSQSGFFIKAAFPALPGTNHVGRPADSGEMRNRGTRAESYSSLPASGDGTV